MKDDIGYSNPLVRKSDFPPLSKPVETLVIAGVALLLLVPCFWQPHIQAGDLASHVYNAWLAEQIRAGAITGLKLVWQPSNVLTDWALEFLMKRFGWVWAERIVVALAVEVFFWGAFAFIRKIAEKSPWLLAPSLAMMAYGLVFHFGFLNFYVSTGLSLWLLRLLWDPAGWRRKIAVAVPLTILAVLAHFVPVVWAALTLGYVYAARRFRDEFKPLALFGGLGMLVAVTLGITAAFPTQWDITQLASLEGVTGLIGVEQFWLYGSKYLVVTAVMAIVWLKLLLDRLDQRSLLSDPMAQLWIIMMAAFAMMPNGIQLVKDQFPLLYVPQRLSLFVGIFFCAMVSRARHGSGLTRISAVAAAIFFTSLFLDVRAFSEVERQVAGLVAGLPPGQRVVVAMSDSGSPRFNGLVHIASEACLGHCYDYANYEPATGGQFRVRAMGPNPVNVATMEAAQAMEEGRHTVTPQEAPIYSVCTKSPQDPTLVLRKLGAGEVNCHVTLAATPQFSK